MLEEGTVFASKEAERAQHSLALFIEKLGLFDGDPHIADVQEALRQHLIETGNRQNTDTLILTSREATALLEKVGLLPTTKRPALPDVLQDWLSLPTYHEERCFLEAHPTLLAPVYEEAFRRFSVLSQKQMVDARGKHVDSPETIKEIKKIIQGYLQLLTDIRARGSTPLAIREAYVNAHGGLVLDVPEWMSVAEQCMERGWGKNADEEPPVEYFTEVLARAKSDTGAAAETVAELYVLLQSALAKDNKPHTQTKQISYLESALKIYTRERYPLQYARVQYALGTLYANLVSGQRRKNREDAIACYEQALEVFTCEISPKRHAAIRNKLGDIYVKRTAGDKITNLETAIMHYQAALKVFGSEQSS